MDMFSMFFRVWLASALIAGVLSAPVVLLGRKRVSWSWWELCALIVRFLVWAFLMCSELATGKKSLANLGEPFYFSAAVPLAALIRVAVGRRVRESVCAGALLLMLCGVSASVFFLVTFLPE